MKSRGLAVSSTQMVANSLLVLSAIAVAAGGSTASVQLKVVTTKNIGVVAYNSIPEATEPCTPAESEWWKKVRKAGNDVQKKSDAKSEARFLLLLTEEGPKPYHVPLKDRPHQTLALKPAAEFAGRNNKITGPVVLSVEFRADGSVGDVQITQGAEFVVAERVIQAARQRVFLPAIRNGAFVTEWGTVELRLWSK